MKIQRFYRMPLVTFEGCNFDHEWSGVSCRICWRKERCHLTFYWTVDTHHATTRQPKWLRLRQKSRVACGSGSWEWTMFCKHSWVNCYYTPYYTPSCDICVVDKLLSLHLFARHLASNSWNHGSLHYYKYGARNNGCWENFITVLYFGLRRIGKSHRVWRETE